MGVRESSGVELTLFGGFMKLRIVRFVLALAGAALPASALHAQTATTAKPANPLAAQQQQVKDAQAAFDTAKRQVLIIRKRVEATFSSKPEWATAKETMDKAKIEFDMAQRRVTTALEKNPDYKKEVARKETSQAVIDQATNPKPTASGEDPAKVTDEQLAAATKDHTEAALAIISMQKNVGENDTAYQASKQKYMDAKAAYDALQTQVDDAVKLDPDYAPAQTAVESADAALKTAREALAAANKAQQDASRKATPTPRPTPTYNKGGGRGG
jgi:hypothetical protein